MPRQLAYRGDRLAFSWGVVLLSAVAALLIVAFGGVTTLLIPLYSVGVFVCFTLSQVGMVRHWRAVRDGGWRWRATVNAFGALLTLTVLVVVASCAVALLTGFVGAIGMRAGLIGTLVLVVFTVFAGTPEVSWEWLPTALLMGLGGVIQTAITCLPPLVFTPSLIHKPEDAGSVIPRLKEIGRAHV